VFVKRVGQVSIAINVIAKIVVNLYLLEIPVNVTVPKLDILENTAR